MILANRWVRAYSYGFSKDGFGFVEKLSVLIGGSPLRQTLLAG
jgi:hypothetical protein